MERQSITVSAEVRAPLKNVWECWTSPQHIVKWNQASDDWHTPRATNDLRKGGKFTSRMEARDGSMGFDFEGIYDNVVLFKKLAYSMADGRKVTVVFSEKEGITTVEETFDAETENSLELQRQGWQAILNNFKKYAEGLQSKFQ